MFKRRRDLGATAPALDLPTASGEPRSLQDFRGRPVVVSFLGAPHCMFCRAHVIRMIQAHREFTSAGAEVLLVACHDPSAIMSQLLRDLQLPYTLLIDRDRAVFTRWGVNIGDWRAYMRPGLYWAFVKQKLAGGGFSGASPNPNQLGGDFVVDRDGRLAFAHRLRSFYDRAPIPRLLETVRTL